MENVKYMPWPEDEIFFKQGNWTVERAEIDGLYRYSVGGVQSYREVDAVQLVEWGMAEAIHYSALTVWEGAEIEFTGKAEILRDLADHTKQVAARCYYLETPAPSGRGMSILRVNRHYLVANGYAVASEAFKRQVAAVSLTKSAASNVWPQDDIVLVPKSGWKVEKGAYSGIYRVSWNTIKYNWNARRLLDEGLAVSAYEKKLSEGAKSTTTRISELKERFHGFWMAKNADKISSLHEIALLWRELETDPNSPMLGAIYSHNTKIYQAYNALDAQYLALGIDESTASGKLAGLEKLHKELKQLDGQYAGYSDVTISALNTVEALQKKVVKTLKQARNMAAEVDALLDKIEANRGKIVGAKTETPFPLPDLPKPATPEMQSERARHENIYRQICARAEYYKTNTASAADTAKMRARLKSITLELYLIEANEKRVSEMVRSVHVRKRDLDRLKPGFGPAYNSRRVPLFQRPWSGDAIRFTTGVKIKHGFIDGMYCLSHCGVYVTADELVYLGLAVYK